MKTKNTSSADSNRASELSDDALLNICGGSTDYAQAAEAVHAGLAAAHGVPMATNVFVEADPRGSLHPTEHVVSGNSPTPGPGTGGPAGVGPAGSLGGLNGKDADLTPHNHQDSNNDCHYSIHNAFEAAHDRFHQQLDHVSDALDSMAKGVGEIAGAMVEISPIVAGVHFLDDIHKKASSKTTKR